MGSVNRNAHETLPQQIKSDIERRIVDGHWNLGEKIPSEGALAREYDVSRMTVRQALVELINVGVLNRIPGKGTFLVKQRTADEELLMPASSMNTVMLVVSNLDATFQTEIIVGAQECFVRSGVELLLRVIHNDMTLERSVLHSAPVNRMDGLILAANPHSGSNVDILMELSRKCPVVVVDRNCKDSAGIDSVVSDDENGAYQITRHLIELGHKRILHIALDPSGTSGTDRLSGYRKALADFGLDCDDYLVRYAYNQTDIDGYSEIKKYFLGARNKQDLPTAVFAGNDIVAAGVYRFFGELGFNIPSDVAVAGYGNLSIGKLLSPQMTTIDQSARVIGRIAAQMVLDKLRGVRPLDSSSLVAVPTKIIARQSCGIQYVRGLDAVPV